MNAAKYAQENSPVSLVQNEQFRQGQIELALRKVIERTGGDFCRQDNSCGCTVLCAVLKGRRCLYLVWLGDSSAVINCNGEPIKLTQPHSAEREDEHERFEAVGGRGYQSDVWRVMGSLAVSRSIGDAAYKPFVSVETDVITFELLGNEDFVVLGCDGLWNYLCPFDVSSILYEYLTVNAHRPVEEVVDQVAKVLSQKAIDEGSQDNITVIVTLLRNLEAIIPRPVKGVAASLNFTNGSTANESNGFATNGHDHIGCANSLPALNPMAASFESTFVNVSSREEETEQQQTFVAPHLDKPLSDQPCRDDPPHSIIDTQFEQQVEQESDDERVCLTAEESAGQESKPVEPQVTISVPDTEHHAQPSRQTAVGAALAPSKLNTIIFCKFFIFF